MITKFKLFENHFDIDPYGEEDWDDNNTFLRWLKDIHPENTWNDITLINCRYNNLTSLEGIENLTNLEYLYCNNNQLTNLEGIENVPKLEVLYCQNNQLTSLDGIENLINLKELSCHHNELTSLSGIEKLPYLKLLHCSNNQLSYEYKQYLKDYCKKNKIFIYIYDN